MPKADPKTETRRARFQAYCRRRGWFDEERQHWAVTEISNATGKPANKISDLLNGKGSFGAKIARELETALVLREYELEAADEPAKPDLTVAENSPTYAPIRPPTVPEAVEALGEALAGMDDLGRKLAAQVLANLAEHPEQAAAMGEQLRQFLATRRRPDPEPPRPRKAKASEPSSSSRAGSGAKAPASGGHDPQMSLLPLHAVKSKLPLLPARNPFDERKAAPSEARWYERVRAAPKAAAGR